MYSQCANFPGMSDTSPFSDTKALGAQLRERCQISPSYASELATGRRQPSLAMAVKIEQELGIPVAAWLGREPHPAAEDAAA
jgi:transcriptional regulator with XRE-family HTH domain